MMLPKTIIELRKLNNLRAGRMLEDEDASLEVIEDLPEVLKSGPCNLLFLMVASCYLCILYHDDIDMSRRAMCTWLCCSAFPAALMHLELNVVLVPRGMRKLEALRTLGVVNIGRRGKDVVKDIKRLVRLRKLGVTGVNKENGQELCSAVVGLSRLESLLIRSEGEPGLCGCLDGKFSFPETLQSLKLYGNLVKLPEWVQGLKNLVKLKLRSTMLSEDNDAMQVLGKLPNLGSLHLLRGSIREDKTFRFRQVAFPSLVFLELSGYISVKFEQGAIPTLEMLKLFWMEVNSDSLSGLPSLSGLKEVVLQGEYSDTELAYLRAELAKNPNRPVLKRV